VPKFNFKYNTGDDLMLNFAKGTVYIKGCTTIYFGSKEKVEKKVGESKTRYRSIYYYEMENEMEEQLKFDKEFLKEGTGVIFVNVDEVLPSRKTS
jgi:hypothetical protein